MCPGPQTGVAMDGRDESVIQIHQHEDGRCEVFACSEVLGESVLIGPASPMVAAMARNMPSGLYDDETPDEYYICHGGQQMGEPLPYFNDEGLCPDCDMPDCICGEGIEDDLSLMEDEEDEFWDDDDYWDDDDDLPFF